jgi:predicted dehydrogenase
MIANQKTIKWGILGCGKIAQKFAADLALSDSGFLYACASRDGQKAALFAKQFDAITYFDSYQALALCEEIDVIYIATPHSYHCDHSILCMNHSKHVLCEKPLAINQLQVHSMLDIAKRNDVFLMEAVWTAFLPAIQDVLTIIKSGAIGDARHLTADFGFQAPYDPKGRLFNPTLAGGSLLDIGIYPLFISLMVMGMPEKIYATGELAQTGVDSECSIQLTYNNKATAALYATLTCHTDTKCEIFGTEGKILIPGRFHEADHYFLTKGENNAIKCQVGRKGYGYFHEIEHVHNCITNGMVESNIMQWAISQQLVGLMDKVRNQIGVKYTEDKVS